MRALGAVIAVAFAVGTPAPVQASDSWAELLQSAQRTPSGIALRAPGGRDMDFVNTKNGQGQETKKQTAKRAEGLTLSFRRTENSAASHRDSLTPRSGLYPYARPSPFLGLPEVEVMARQDGGGMALHSAFVISKAGQRLAASELAIDAGGPDVLLQGGVRNNRAEPLDLRDGAFGGAAFEGDLGAMEYSLGWQGSLDGGHGMLSLRHQQGRIAISRDLDAGVTPRDTSIRAHWYEDLGVGGLRFSLNGRPVEQEAAAQLDWSFEW